MIQYEAFLLSMVAKGSGRDLYARWKIFAVVRVLVCIMSESPLLVYGKVLADKGEYPIQAPIAKI